MQSPPAAGAKGMENFVKGRPDLVRAINQRWLLHLWNRIRDGRALPAWQDLNTDELESISRNLSYFEVVRDGGETRFLIRFHGAQMGEVYGSYCVGKFLDDILPAALRDSALVVYRYLTTVRQPLYTIAEIRDDGRRLVQFERLLLPFGSDSGGVEWILTSHELVSPDGAFQSRDLMRSQTKPPIYSCCVTIQH